MTDPKLKPPNMPKLAEDLYEIVVDLHNTDQYPEEKDCVLILLGWLHHNIYPLIRERAQPTDAELHNKYCCGYTSHEPTNAEIEARGAVHGDRTVDARGRVEYCFDEHALRMFVRDLLGREEGEGE